MADWKDDPEVQAALARAAEISAIMALPEEPRPDWPPGACTRYR
jgi:hypothetical protein